MENAEELPRVIKRLLASQLFAVLATESGGQPFGNLVAFAGTEDLKSLLFVTSRDTRKYFIARKNERVALLIDSRTNKVSDLELAMAVTAIGVTQEVITDERNRLVNLYVLKHPSLSTFVNNSANALIKINVTEYVLASFSDTQVLKITN